MLTNEQALALIKQTKRCFVVWDTRQNAIVAVHEIPADTSPEQSFQLLSSMPQGPTMGRFLDSASVTLEMLEEQQSDIHRMGQRVLAFTSWTQSSTNELIRILEEADVPGPVDVYRGCSYIIDLLYRFRSADLTEPRIARLERLLLSEDPGFAAFVKPELECYLAVWREDPTRLKKLWREHLAQQTNWAIWEAFTAAAGDLGVSDPDIVAHLIEVVETPSMFGPRFAAAMALGKIGPAAGPRAAAVIQSVIYDNSDFAAVRDRAVARIRSKDAEWIRCPACMRGYTLTVTQEGPRVEPCGVCHRLTFVPSQE